MFFYWTCSIFKKRPANSYFQILTDQPFTKNIVTSWKLTKRRILFRLLTIPAVVEEVAFSLFSSHLEINRLVEFIDPDGSNTLLLSSVLAIAKGLLQRLHYPLYKIATFIFMTKIIHDHKLAIDAHHHHEEIKHKRKIVTAFRSLFVTGSGVL